MVTVSVKQLVSAIEEADAFKLPDMNRGTRYLYDRIYGAIVRRQGDSSVRGGFSAVLN